jgi:hypothetical protein
MVAHNQTGFVNSEQSANPGFTQAPIQANIPPPQTFAAPTAPTAPTAPSFVSPPSLAPTGGLPRKSTSYTVGPPRSRESDIPWGTIAGGGALAAALAAYGDDGGGMGFGSILAGAKKLYELADMSDMDIIGKLPAELQKMFKEFTDTPSKLMDIFGTTPTAPTTASGLFSGVGPIFSAPGVAGMFPGAATSTAALQSAVAAQIPGHTLASLSASGFSPMGGALAGVTGVPAASATPFFGAGVGGLGGVSTAMGAPAAASLYGGGMGVAPTALAPAGTGSILGVAGPVAALAGFAMFMKSRMAAKKDPTADTRSANQLENYFQKAINESGEDRENTLKEIQMFIYENPIVLNTIKIASSGGQLPFGAKHTSGGTKIIGWSPNISKFVNENMGILKEAFEWGEQKAPGAPGDPVRINPYSDLGGVVGRGVYIHPEAGG